MKKEDLINEILMAVKASEAKVDGDLFFSLAFRTKEELIEICKKAGIKTIV